MSHGATARLFVAVDPPPYVSGELLAWARGVAGAARRPDSRDRSRWAPRLLDAESLHLTLCFLGSRPVGEIDALVQALLSAPQQPCELSLGAPVWLPPRRPRALAVEIHDPVRRLERLHEHVGEAMRLVSGWAPERRRFRPHITLARMRAGAGEPPAAAILPAVPQMRFTARAVVLYRSWLAPEGASYEALATVRLAPGEA
jgi:RNA 2',3'-cyclic 3'-phosphodiesterase